MVLTLDRALEIVHTVVKAGQSKSLPIAVTAVNFGAPTKAVLEMIEGEAFLLAAVMKESELSLISGGFPIRIDGELVGGLGIAGARYTDDHAIGEQVLEGL
jgi:uncharacterized protein GlcG (DUF336 family)